MKTQNANDRLLEAALKLFSKKGYLGATTREIAHGAGVTELTLFRHFGSKERLFEKVLHRYTFLPRLKHLLPELAKVPYDEALRMIGIRFLETLKEEKSLVRIMLSEMSAYPERVKIIHNRLIDEVVQTLASYVGPLQKKGTLRSSSPEAVAIAFLGMIFSYFQREEIVRKADITKEQVVKVVEEFIDIFMYGTVKT